MTQTAPGWYPSPDSRELLQYWDGEMWTDRHRPAAAAAVQETVAPGLTHGPDPKLFVTSELTDTLNPGEEIIAGFVGTTGWKRSVLAATDSRIIHMQRRAMRRARAVTTINYEDVTDVRTRISSGMTRVTVVTAADKFSSYAYALEHALGLKQFVELRSAEHAEEPDPEVARTRHPAPSPGLQTVASTADARQPDSDQPDGDPPHADQPSANPTHADQPSANPTHADQPERNDDLVDRLERLAALHGQGALTDEEFAAAKAQLLRDLEEK